MDIIQPTDKYSKNRTIDLNCDCGESFGAWRMGDDAALLRWVSSANIACGFHAGDPSVMLHTIELCLHHKVSIGAHPGLRDLQGFGRRELAISAADLYADTIYQLGALSGLCLSRNTRLHHVKPHGALYHQLDRDASLAHAFVDAVQACSENLLIFGPADGELQAAAKTANLRYCREGFVERGYAADGSLLPRAHAGAVLHEPSMIVAQACELALNGRVRCATDPGHWLSIPVQTLCIHGDRADAAVLAQQIREALLAAQLRIDSPYATRT
jgi:UPF0271 protein